ncbi:MAG TPA: HAMP domain-containing sensor histidine kinase [Coleofasciculaceae cyanobacterium]|jgi:hypothetical protein
MNFLDRTAQNLKRKLDQKLNTLKRKGFDPTSLQFRLTLGLTAVSLLGMSSIGSWTSWQMRQMLVVDHQNYLKTLSDRLPTELATRPADAMDSQLQALVNQGGSPHLWLWVKSDSGKVLATSTNLASFPGDAALMPQSMMPLQPEVAAVNGRYLMLCSTPLRVEGKTIAQLYLARDITHDYEVQTTLVNSLRFATVLAIVVIGTSVAYMIWRSLHPLRQIDRQMNQLAIAPSETAGKFTGDRSAHSWQLDDIPSEMQGLVQAFDKLSTRLIEADDQQRQFTNQFTSSISHEIRTSLSLVYGYLQSTLRRCNNLTDSQKEALEVAVDETERTIQLLKDLVDLSRINSDTMEFSLEPVVLNDLVVMALEMSNLSGATVKIKTADDLVVAQADSSQLVRVVNHLLENAARYAKGQPIVIQLSETSNHALLQVCDRGCGIPLADQARIFEPFYRVEHSRCRSTGGIGLGLAIVKSLVEGMQGQVTVESQPGEGSVFSVMLPLGCPNSPLPHRLSQQNL